MRNLLLLFAVFACAALAADPTGTWKASFETPNGSREITMKFQADGNKLTGTVSSQMGETAIQEGKVDGDNISFVVVRKREDQEFRMSYKGTVSGDTMKLKTAFGDREFEMTAKKQ